MSSSNNGISLTVKTLDSRNHSFTDLDPEMTVRELKRKISPKVGIPSERQRLIYCGRVLQDDKKLGEHSLDGKVLHLVSRQPSNGSPDRVAAFEAVARNRRPPSSQNGGVNITFHHTPPIRATAAPDSAFINFQRSSANVRLQFANRMLRRANVVINQLRNPEEGPSPASSEEAPSASTATSEAPTTSANVATSEAPTTPASDTTSETPATSAAAANSETPVTSATPTTSGTTSTTNATTRESGISSEMSNFLNFNNRPAVISTVSIQVEPERPASAVASTDMSEREMEERFTSIFGQILENNGVSRMFRERGVLNNNSNPTSTSTTSTGGDRTGASTTTTTSTSSSSSANTRPSEGSSIVEHPPPRAFAQVMEEYARTTNRLAPFSERLISLLNADPELPDSVVREHQVFYNNITLAMHYLSHAQHAMSDILLNLSSSPPRVIRGRPFVLQQPVVSGASLTHRRPQQTSSMGPSPPSTMNSSSTSTSAPASVPTLTPAAARGGEEPEIGFTIEAQPIVLGIEIPDEQYSNIRSTAGNNIPPGGVAFVDSHDEDFISNIIRATIGQLQQTTAAVFQNGRTTSSASSQASNSTPSRSSQRSSDLNSETQPTTSTRTRSSPHVHYAATPMGVSSALSAGMPIGHMNSFDPFLQCNSHHIPQEESGISSGEGRWTFDRHPIRRRTRHPAGFQIHRGSHPRSSSVPPIPNPFNNFSTSSSVPQDRGRNVGDPLTGRGPSSASSSPERRRRVPFSMSSGDLPGGIVEPGLRGLINQIVSLNPSMSASAGNSDDQMMLNMIQGVLRNVVGALGLQGAEGSSVGTGGSSSAGNQSGNQTVEQFLSSLPDYNYVSGESVVTDLLMTLARHLTFRDLVFWVFGGGEVILSQLREPLREFVRSQLMSGETTEEAVQVFVDAFYPQMEEIASVASVKPEIDFAETLHKYLIEKMVLLISIILREGEHDTFGRDISNQIRNIFMGLTALGLQCFTEGPASLERVVQNRLVALCEDGLGPVVRDWTMSVATGHLRNYIASLETNNIDVSRYIVKRGPESEARKLERNRRMEVNSNSANVEDDHFQTPRSSPELMDVEEDKEHASKETTEKESITKGNESDVVPVDPNLQFPSNLLNWQRESDTPISSENWHRPLPPDWVPIITRDISRQRSEANQPSASTSASSLTESVEDSIVQAPFSDAYLSSQSAKRRKLTTSKKPERGTNIESVIADSLNEALSETGIVTLTDVNRIAGSAEVIESVELKTKSVIKKKLSEDLDFAESPDGRFPSSKAFSSKK